MATVNRLWRHAFVLVAGLVAELRFDQDDCRVPRRSCVWMVNSPVYTLSFVVGSRGRVKSLPAGYVASSRRTPKPSGMEKVVGIRYSSLGVWELMCRPCAMRKCSVTGLGFPSGNGDLLGKEILDGVALERRSGSAHRTGLGCRAATESQPRSKPHRSPRNRELLSSVAIPNSHAH